MGGVRVAKAGWAAVLAGLLAGCAAPRSEVLPASLVVATDWRAERLLIERETPHLELRHPAGVAVSESDLAVAEEHVTSVARALDIDPPRKILYLVLPPERMLELTGAAGTSESLTRPAMALLPEAAPLRSEYDGIVLSASPRSLHELTHCVSARWIEPEDFLMRSPLVFEGLAIAWQGRSREWIEERLERREGVAPLPNPRDLVTAFPPAENAAEVEAAYLVAGSFVAFLIETRGSDRFVELLRRGRKDRFDAVFEEAYGVPFAVVEAQWRERRTPATAIERDGRVTPR
jgi:hypothetical protein